MDLKHDFKTYWKKMKPLPKFENRKRAAEDEWNRHPEKQIPIICWLDQHGAYPGRNPYFFIQDFQPRDQPQPEWLRGDEKDLDIVQVHIGDAYKLCTRETMDTFNLQYIMDWN